jgi:hypothetical protein
MPVGMARHGQGMVASHCAAAVAQAARARQWCPGSGIGGVNMRRARDRSQAR